MLKKATESKEIFFYGQLLTYVASAAATVISGIFWVEEGKSQQNRSQETKQNG